MVEFNWLKIMFIFVVVSLVVVLALIVLIAQTSVLLSGPERVFDPVFLQSLL